MGGLGQPCATNASGDGSALQRGEGGTLRVVRGVCRRPRRAAVRLKETTYSFWGLFGPEHTVSSQLTRIFVF